MDVTTIWIVAWILALVFAFWKLKWVESQSQGNNEIAKIAGHIRNGAMAFLNREYRVLGIFVAVVAALLFLCLLYTSPSPRDLSTSRMPSSA